MGLKPSTIEQTKFEYSPLVNKGLDKDDQKEGLFKRLKNIENAQRNEINSKDKEDNEDNEDNGDEDKKYNKITI